MKYINVKLNLYAESSRQEVELKLVSLEHHDDGTEDTAVWIVDSYIGAIINMLDKRCTGTYIVQIYESDIDDLLLEFTRRRKDELFRQTNSGIEDIFSTLLR